MTKSAAEVLENGVGICWAKANLLAANQLSNHVDMSVVETESYAYYKRALETGEHTVPEYRRQGIACRTLDLLVKDAKEQGILKIALEATNTGRTLYEKYGFVKMEHEIELI